MSQCKTHLQRREQLTQQNEKRQQKATEKERESEGNKKNKIETVIPRDRNRHGAGNRERKGGGRETETHDAFQHHAVVESVKNPVMFTGTNGLEHLVCWMGSVVVHRFAMPTLYTCSTSLQHARLLMPHARKASGRIAKANAGC